MSPEILLTPRFYLSYIQTLKILVKFYCSHIFYCQPCFLSPLKEDFFEISDLKKNSLSLKNTDVKVEPSLTKTDGINSETYCTWYKDPVSI